MFLSFNRDLEEPPKLQMPHGKLKGGSGGERVMAATDALPAEAALKSFCELRSARRLLWVAVKRLSLGSGQLQLDNGMHIKARNDEAHHIACPF
jgi:hypothetical protein